MAFRKFFDLPFTLQEDTWLLAIPRARPNAHHVALSDYVLRSPDNLTSAEQSLVDAVELDATQARPELFLYDDTGRTTPILVGQPGKVHIALEPSSYRHPHPVRMTAIRSLLATCRASRRVALRELERDESSAMFGLWWPDLKKIDPARQYCPRVRRVDGARDLVLLDDTRGMELTEDTLETDQRTFPVANYIENIGIHLRSLKLVWETP
jgi:hypothetical protein